MAQDLRVLFREEKEIKKESMPIGHEARFLKKLEENSEYKVQKSLFSRWWRIAASIVVLIGLGFGTYKYFDDPIISGTEIANQEDVSKNEQLKSLGDISPGLKKIEDYYLANINLELSNVSLDGNNKELFDSYVERLTELNQEYKKLSIELTENGPNELTVSALIDNLKLRLNLLYRLKEKLSELNQEEDSLIKV